MGSSGNFSANVQIQYKISVTKKNSDLAIKKFLKDNKPVKITKQIEATEANIKKAYKDKEIVTLSYKDYDDWDSTTEDLQGMIDALDEYTNSEYYEMWITHNATAKELEYINLKEVIKINEYIPSNLKITETIGLNLTGTIYYDDDNREYASINLKKLKKYMDSPDAKLILCADGNGEN